MMGADDKGDEYACRFAARCPMFPKFQSKAILSIFQSRYCASAFETCERYKLAIEGKMPPPTLLPNGDSLPEA